MLTEEGEVENPVIEHSFAVLGSEEIALAEMEKEAIKGIQATSGHWVPAIKDDKPIAIRLVVPVSFSL